MALALKASANAAFSASLQAQGHTTEMAAATHRSVSITASKSSSPAVLPVLSPKHTSLRPTPLPSSSRNVALATPSLRLAPSLAVPVRSEAASLEAAPAETESPPAAASTAATPTPPLNARPQRPPEALSTPKTVPVAAAAPAAPAAPAARAETTPPAAPAMAAKPAKPPVTAVPAVPAVPAAPAAPAVPAVAEASVEEGAPAVGLPEEEGEGAIAEAPSDSSEAAAKAAPEETQSEEEGFYEPMFELLAAAKVVPHPDKVEKGGEDAFLISDVGAGVICVADGVGGWANDGVDPALYSKELMAHLEAAVESAEVQEDLDPQTLLLRAHAATEAEGASTAVVAVFDGEESALQVANVGDSGVMIVRQGEVIFRSQSQQHYFDCPYQLGSESSDTPKDADLYAVPVQEGDTIVMGSDGLFDNVFDKDIASVVKVFGGKDEVAVQRSATALAALASKHAGDPEYMSPYTLEAVEQGQDLPVWEKMLGRKRQGGKLDDITVVVAQVVKAGSLSRSG